MKITLVSVILFWIVFGCSKKENDQTSVQSFTLINGFYLTKIEKYDYTDSLTESTEIIYDSQNRTLTSNVDDDADGIIDSSLIEHLNQIGNVERSEISLNDTVGQIRILTNYEYNDNDMLINTTSEGQDDNRRLDQIHDYGWENKYEIVYHKSDTNTDGEYDGIRTYSRLVDGQILSEIDRNNDGLLEDKAIWFLNDTNQVTKYETYDIADRRGKYRLFEYDKYGNLSIEEVYFPGSNEIVGKIIYTYKATSDNIYNYTLRRFLLGICLPC